MKNFFLLAIIAILLSVDVSAGVSPNVSPNTHDETMAGLIETTIQSGRARKNRQSLDRFEHRVTRFGTYNAFRGDTPILLNKRFIESIKKSESHEVEAIVTKKNGNVTVNNVRSCVIQPRETESARYLFVWATYSTDFTMQPNNYYDNEIAMQDDMLQKIREAEEAIGKEIESQCFATMQSGKTLSTAYNPAASRLYQSVGDVIEVPFNERYDVYNRIDSILEYHDLPTDQVNIVADLVEKHYVDRRIEAGSLKIERGAITDSVEAWMFQNKRIQFTRHMPVVAGIDSRFFVSAPGSFGILDWTPLHYRNGAKTTKEGLTFEMTPALPILGLPMAHHYNSECIGAANIQANHQLSVDICTVHAYNSDPANLAGPIFEFQVQQEIVV